MFFSYSAITAGVGMINKETQAHSQLGERGGQNASKSLAWLFCPCCGNDFHVGASLHGELVRLAVQLQIQVNGTHVLCKHCSKAFVLRELPWCPTSLDDDTSENLEAESDNLDPVLDDELSNGAR